ncbi:MAG: UDP-N-acetylglucosamine 2-epimerase (non-hydrolyzing) [Caldilineales bacterium]|nr:UDP-N-acetylglucosamine 2-epimerase (non-hydrolyzing) [Caldilineales bacterium]
MTSNPLVLHVVGARPNMMKIAPIMKAMSELGRCSQLLVHTGQHYDFEMSEVFIQDLRMPYPDIRLEVGSASHAVQTAQIMIAFEQVLIHHQPTLVCVVGDVNSTLACTLVAAKLHIPVAHVEAGLRSNNRRMPEEINRIVTDSISDILFTTERQSAENLTREGISVSKIHFVGNVMVDSLLSHRELSRKSKVLERFRLRSGHYGLVTLHRPDNVDNRDRFMDWINKLGRLSYDLPILFPVHPRTQKRIDEGNLNTVLASYPGISLSRPLGYLDFLHAMANAQLVMTDSGGIQEETTALGIPCLTLREETERPITVLEGTNVVIGNDPSRLLAEAYQILCGNGKTGRIPELWDGHAATRIAQILDRFVGSIH